MIARLTSNPLYVRARYRYVKVPFCSGLKFGLAIGGVRIVFAILSGYSYLVVLVLLPFSLVVVVTTPLVAYTAAVVTANEMGAMTFELLSITSLSNGRLVEGYLLSVLSRFRGLFSITLGFAPFAIIGGVYANVYYCPRVYPWQDPICPWSQSPEIILIALAGYVLFAANIAGICLLTAVFGIFLAAWWKNRIMASLITAITSATASMMLYMTGSSRGVVLLEQNLILFPAICVTGAVFMLLARSFARKLD